MDLNEWHLLYQLNNNKLRKKQRIKRKEQLVFATFLNSWVAQYFWQNTQK